MKLTAFDVKTQKTITIFWKFRHEILCRFLLLQIVEKADIMGDSERSDSMEWETSVSFWGGTRLLHVRYFVLPPAKSEDLPLPCYGIGIQEGEETLSVPFFSPTRKAAIDVARSLCTHHVTPVSFFEVLDDLLATDTLI